ncbi:MAG: hypothetical protein QW292_06275 [Candidatus Parvarchaeota archaeon]
MASDLNPFDGARTTGKHYSWAVIAFLGDFLDRGMLVGTPMKNSN